MQARLGRETRRGKAAGRHRTVAFCICWAVALAFAVAILAVWISGLLAATAILAGCFTGAAILLLRRVAATEPPTSEAGESTACIDLTLRSTFDALPTAICLANVDGSVPLVNKSMRRLARKWTGSIGNSIDSISGFFDALASSKTNSDAIELVRMACHDIFAGERSGFDQVVAIQRSASCRYYHLRMMPLPNRTMLLISLDDVTRRKHFESENITARKELRASNERAAALARVFADSPLYSFICDRHTNQILEANVSASKAIGVGLEQLRERLITDFVAVAEFDSKSIGTKLPIAAHGSCEFGGSLLPEQSEPLPVAINTQCVRYLGKDALVVIATDLSERTRIQQQLQRARKLETLGQMAAGVTHEINSPIQFISGSVEYVEQATPKVLQLVATLRDHLRSPQLPAAVTERTKIATKALEESRFADLQRDIPEAIADCTDGLKQVTEIVSAAKAMSHPGVSQAVAIDLNELLRKATVITRSSWKRIGEVVFDLDPDLPPIEGHPTALGRVFVNLIVNAIDAINESQEQIARSTSDGVIVVSSAQRQDCALVEISDNGNGMPAELIERVFDPFFTTKEFGKGTGQGLAICRDTIVNKHGGHIDVVSTPGHGSKFSILLPIGESKPQPTATTTDAHSID